MPGTLITHASNRAGTKIVSNTLLVKDEWTLHIEKFIIAIEAISYGSD